jgi:hypothetical protein
MTHEVERRFAQAAASPGEEMSRRQARPGRASTKGGPSTKKPTGRETIAPRRQSTGSSSGLAASGVGSPSRIAKSHAKGENRAMMPRAFPFRPIYSIRALWGRTFASRPAFPRPVIRATFS